MKRFICLPIFENVSDDNPSDMFCRDEQAMEIFESVIVAAYSERFSKFVTAHSGEENLRQKFCNRISAELLFEKWLDLASEQAARDRVQQLAGHFNGMKLGRV